jgi:hypothetical protein
MRICYFLLGGCLALLLGPGHALTQAPRGGRKNIVIQTDGSIAREQLLKALQAQKRLFAKPGKPRVVIAPPAPPKGNPPGPAKPTPSPPPQGGGAGSPPGATPPGEEPKPIVYRAGKLPKGLPPWFRQLDTDNDGQIGLYEWVQAGLPIAEFKALDRNRDGFLTIQEVMRAKKQGLVTDRSPALQPLPVKKGARPPSAADRLR